MLTSDQKHIKEFLRLADTDCVNLEEVLTRIESYSGRLTRAEVKISDTYFEDARQDLA